MTRKGLIFLGVTVAVILMVGIGIRLLFFPDSSRVPKKSGARAVPSAQRAVPRSVGSKSLLARAKKLEAQGSLLEAKQLYQRILQQTSESRISSQVTKRLGEVNLELLLSSRETPEAITYTVKGGDTLFKISKKFSTTVELLKVANGLESDLIRVGQRLKVTKAKFNLIIDKSQNLLTLKNKEEVLKVYRCSTGKEGVTPTGKFRIASRLVDPAWKGIYPSDHPENPLGSRWLGFDLQEYGIHGTRDPKSIGKPVTKGCVRLKNADVEELFTLLPKGTQVTIVD